MQDLGNTQYFKVETEPETGVKLVLSTVYEALTEKGYNPVNQIVGYIMSGDPTYITSHKGARSMIMKVERDELVEELDCVTERKGKGLMQGVVCKLPVGKVAAAALEQGLIVITAGADVLRFVPPLVIEKQHVDEMIEKLEKALLSVQE